MSKLYWGDFSMIVMSQTISGVLVMFSLLLVGCQRAPDFRQITSNFNESKKSGVSKIELIPINVGTNLKKLSNKITLTDAVLCESTVREIRFDEDPELPREMEHSARETGCKMLIHFKSGRTFCFYIIFRRGLSGAGIEYAINPDLNLDDYYDNQLPGPNSLGRGYSVALYYALLAAISHAGEGWTKGP